MTVKEQERLAVVETKVDNICEDVQEIKQMIKDANKNSEKRVAAIEEKAKSYVTVPQLRLILTVLSVVITSIFLVLNYLKV